MSTLLKPHAYSYAGRKRADGGGNLYPCRPDERMPRLFGAPREHRATIRSGTKELVMHPSKGTHLTPAMRERVTNMTRLGMAFYRERKARAAQMSKLPSVNAEPLEQILFDFMQDGVRAPEAGIRRHTHAKT